MADESREPMQFDTVQGQAAAAACTACQRTIPDVYFETAGRVFCAQCKDSALASLAGGSRIARLFKAIVFGSVAAAVSAVAWYAITELTGYQLGIVAIVVGWAVGVATRIGSEGRGGWPYQIIAVVLAYVAIAMSYVPMVVEDLRTRGAAEEAAAMEEAKGTEAEEVAPAIYTTAVYGVAVMISLALPVLLVTEGSGFIGLLIVGFALFEAWRINKSTTLSFTGPFRVGARAPGAA